MYYLDTNGKCFDARLFIDKQTGETLIDLGPEYMKQLTGLEISQQNGTILLNHPSLDNRYVSDDGIHYIMRTS